jgi:hypothetical protein
MGLGVDVFRSFVIVAALAATLSGSCARAQEIGSAASGSQKDSANAATPDSWLLGPGSWLLAPGPQSAAETAPSAAAAQDPPSAMLNSGEEIAPYEQSGQQPKRILWIIPNYRAVGADTQLPPMRFREKFWLATEDTLDYSDFVFVGALSGISLAQKSEPSLGPGARGYGRYYWRIFLDTGIENYMTEALVPVATKEDPRYYTLGHGGFLKRTGYALSRLVVTRTDGGRNTFNISEIAGSGAAAGIGNWYYPPQSNPWVKTYQRWGTQVALDGAFNLLKEFWPDIDRVVFHGKY